MNWITANDSGVWKRGHDKHGYRMVPPLLLDEPGYTLDVPACTHEVPMLLCLLAHFHMHGSLRVPYRISEFMFYPVVVEDLLCSSQALPLLQRLETIGQGFDHGSPTYVNQTVNVPKEGALTHSFSLMS